MTDVVHPPPLLLAPIIHKLIDFQRMLLTSVIDTKPLKQRLIVFLQLGLRSLVSSGKIPMTGMATAGAEIGRSESEKSVNSENSENVCMHGPGPVSGSVLVVPAGPIPDR